MKAADLRQAVRLLDPERPHGTREELVNYFVQRPMSPLADLKIMLEDAGEPQKFLFSGHRGSGKSTELAKLRMELDDEFFVIHYSIKSILNLFDLTYVDVVLSLGLELIRRVTSEDSQIEVSEAVLENILKFTKDITREVEITSKDEGGIGAELNFFVARLSGKLGTEVATREIVRERIQHRLSDLLDNIEFLYREIEKKSGRRTLVIVEDLDKTDLNTAESLSYSYATSLTAPYLNVIYTFPIALRHDYVFPQITMNFPSYYFLPNLNIRLRDGTPGNEGLTCLREILTRRVDENLFEPEVIDRLGELSSGIPRELIALTRQACIEARKSERPKVNLEDVQQAARRRRNDYQVLLTARQIDLLRNVRDTKHVENDEDHQMLFHTLSIMEYGDIDGVWHDVHPIILPLLADSE